MSRPTRRGPTLGLALSDPGRGTDALRAAVADAAEAIALPTSVETGDEEGLVHLVVWAGDLGLGLPGDSPDAWADLGRALGTVAERVEPVLALCAVEWAARSLLDPDAEALRPGLASGWARRTGLDPVRTAALDQLAERDVVVATGRGWRWCADGAVGLGDAPAVPADRVVSALFHAWWGRAPEAEPPEGPWLVLTAPMPTPGLAEAAAAALPDGSRVEARSPTTVVALPPAWRRDEQVLVADLTEAAVLLDAAWAGLGADPDEPRVVWP